MESTPLNEMEEDLPGLDELPELRRSYGDSVSPTGASMRLAHMLLGSLRPVEIILVPPRRHRPSGLALTARISGTLPTSGSVNDDDTQSTEETLHSMLHAIFVQPYLWRCNSETITPETQLSLVSISEAKECSICFEDMEAGSSVYDLRCGHTFHPECLKQWLGTKRTCPLCRGPVYESACSCGYCDMRMT